MQAVSVQVLPIKLEFNRFARAPVVFQNGSIFQVHTRRAHVNNESPRDLVLVGACPPCAQQI